MENETTEDQLARLCERQRKRLEELGHEIVNLRAVVSVMRASLDAYRRAAKRGAQVKRGELLDVLGLAVSLWLTLCAYKFLAGGAL